MELQERPGVHFGMVRMIERMIFYFSCDITEMIAESCTSMYSENHALINWFYSLKLYMKWTDNDVLVYLLRNVVR